MISIDLNAQQLARIRAAIDPVPIRRAVRKAMSTGLRDMKSVSNKRIRELKRLKVRDVAKALKPRWPRGNDLDTMTARLDFYGTPIALGKYPVRQTKKGVSVAINTGGKRTLIKGAFIARMKSKHRGVFEREGRARLPIAELYGSRPVDAMLKKQEPEKALAKGADSFRRAALRLIEIEWRK